ncbi:MAG: hypothetical protein ACM3VZ_11285 [Acidobacteriota bacterium]
MLMEALMLNRVTLKRRVNMRRGMVYDKQPSLEEVTCSWLTAVKSTMAPWLD